jgi:hypothetical protein
MGLTTDPDDPRLGHGVDKEPGPQNEVYLILSEEERAKGFVRPYRDVYRHVGPLGPRFPLRDLSEEQRERYDQYGYVKYEEYPPELEMGLGRYWTQAALDAVGKGCGVETRMGRELSETYARDPNFYGATYCVGCRKHWPVNEFVWIADGERVGS